MIVGLYNNGIGMILMVSLLLSFLCLKFPLISFFQTVLVSQKKVPPICMKEENK